MTYAGYLRKTASASRRQTLKNVDILEQSISPHSLQNDNVVSKNKLCKRKTICIDERAYMRSKSDVDPSFSKEDEAKMKQIHLQHILHDKVSLIPFLYPSTSNDHSFNTVIRIRDMLRDRKIRVMQTNFLNSSQISQKEREQEIKRGESRARSSAAVDFDLTLDTQEYGDYVINDIQDDIASKWYQTMKKYGGAQNEYKLDKMRKIHEQRIKRKRIEQQEKMKAAMEVEPTAEQLKQRKLRMLQQTDHTKAISRFLPMYYQNVSDKQYFDTLNKQMIANRRASAAAAKRLLRLSS